MGLLSWMFPKRRAHDGPASVLATAGGALGVPPGHEAVAWAKGNGAFLTEVVGESHYQAALASAAGGRSFDGVDVVVVASLVPEDHNPHDPNAVCVKINDRTVGYLSRADAKRFRVEAATAIAQGLAVHCQANIRGGWDRGDGDRGHFGVWLDTGDE